MYRVCPEGSNPQDWWDNRGVYYNIGDAECRAQTLADREDKSFEVRTHTLGNPVLHKVLHPRNGPA